MKSFFKRTDKITRLLMSVRIDIVYFLSLLYLYRAEKSGGYLFILLLFCSLICWLYRTGYYEQANLYENVDEIKYIIITLTYASLHLYFANEAMNLSIQLNKYITIFILLFSIIKLVITILKIFFKNLFFGLFLLLYLALLVLGTSSFIGVFLNVCAGLSLYLVINFYEYESDKNKVYRFTDFLKDNNFEFISLFFLGIAIWIAPFITNFILTCSNNRTIDQKTYSIVRFIVIYSTIIVFFIISKGVRDFKLKKVDDCNRTDTKH